MGSSGLRLLCGVSVLSLLSACGDLAVQSFAGSVIELSLAGIGETPAWHTSSSGRGRERCRRSRADGRRRSVVWPDGAQGDHVHRSLHD